MNSFGKRKWLALILLSFSVLCFADYTQEEEASDWRVLEAPAMPHDPDSVSRARAARLRLVRKYHPALYGSEDKLQEINSLWDRWVEKNKRQSRPGSPGAGAPGNTGGFTGNPKAKPPPKTAQSLLDSASDEYLTDRQFFQEFKALSPTLEQWLEWAARAPKGDLYYYQEPSLSRLNHYLLKEGVLELIASLTRDAFDAEKVLRWYDRYRRDFSRKNLAGQLMFPNVKAIHSNSTDATRKFFEKIASVYVGGEKLRVSDANVLLRAFNEMGTRPDTIKLASKILGKLRSGENPYLLEVPNIPFLERFSWLKDNREYQDALHELDHALRTRNSDPKQDVTWRVESLDEKLTKSLLSSEKATWSNPHNFDVWQRTMAASYPTISLLIKFPILLENNVFSPVLSLAGVAALGLGGIATVATPLFAPEAGRRLYRTYLRVNRGRVLSTSCVRAMSFFNSH